VWDFIVGNAIQNVGPRRMKLVIEEQVCEPGRYPTKYF